MIGFQGRTITGTREHVKEQIKDMVNIPEITGIVEEAPAQKEVGRLIWVAEEDIIGEYYHVKSSFTF